MSLLPFYVKKLMLFIGCCALQNTDIYCTTDVIVIFYWTERVFLSGTLCPFSMSHPSAPTSMSKSRVNSCHLDQRQSFQMRSSSSRNFHLPLSCSTNCLFISNIPHCVTICPSGCAKNTWMGTRCHPTGPPTLALWQMVNRGGNRKWLESRKRQRLQSV